MGFVIASTIGPKALYLLVAWLAGGAVGGHLSARKGYGDKPGVATGLLLSLLAIPIWLLIPARAPSSAPRD